MEVALEASLNENFSMSTLPFLSFLVERLDKVAVECALTFRVILVDTNERLQRRERKKRRKKDLTRMTKSSFFLCVSFGPRRRNRDRDSFRR